MINKWPIDVMKKLFTAGFFMLMLLALSACIPGEGARTLARPAGFFSGIWHGWIAPFSLIISLFDSSISIYEVYNTGWWYDFGFYMAIISGFGGISLFRHKKYEKIQVS